MSRSVVPPNVHKMVRYVPGKPVSELKRELGLSSIVKLASNESPFGPSPKVIDAIQKEASSAHIYPDAATYSVTQALSTHLDCPAEDIVLGNGSNELIDLCCRTFAAPGDHIVFGKPSFVCYWLGSIASNVDYTEAPLDEHLAWNVDALLDAVTDKTTLMFVANPNNPTGAHLGKSELERLLKSVPKHIVVVLDEAYFEFATAEDYETALTMRGLRERLLVLRTFSKAYGLAALRVGYGVGPSELIDFLHRMRAPFNVNSLAQQAAIAALEDKAFLEKYITFNAEQRAAQTVALSQMGLEVAPSQGNFVLVKTPLAGADLYQHLLKLGVIVRAMPAPIDHWVRITIGTKEENNRLNSALKKVLSDIA